MLITQRVNNLLNGVSQQPMPLRLTSQADLCENAYATPARGLRKRPPTTHIGKLSVSTAGWGTAFTALIDRTDTDKYLAVVANNDLQVFDVLSGTSVPVQFPQGKGYLTGTDFRATTVGDATFLLNRAKTVKLGTKKQTDPAFEALLFVRQVDYSVVYTVTLNGQTVTIKTLDPSAASSSTLGTDTVADDLVLALRANTAINSTFTVTRIGSSVYLKRQDAADFNVTVSDGLGDKGLVLIKGKVQSVADLPAKAPSGMMLEVTGDPGSDKDNFWVSFETPKGAYFDGVWRECPAPGSALQLDPTTMPWALTLKGSLSNPVAHQAQPKLPEISYPFATLFKQGWTLKNGGAATATNDQLITDHNDKLETTLTSGSPTNNQFTVTYDVDTTLLDPGVSVVLTLQVTDAGSVVHVLDKRQYTSGVLERNVQMQGTNDWGTTGKVGLVLTYSTGASPTKKAVITGHGQNHLKYAGILYLVPTSTDIAFDATAQYPGAATYSFNVAGYPYTMSLGDSTANTGTTIATTLASGLNGLVGTPFVASNPSPGVCRVTPSDGYSSVSTTVSGGIDAAKVFVNYGMNLTFDSLIGKTVKNLTDGSTGVVTGNSSVSITCSAGLTGGSTNKFTVGDLIAVVDAGLYFVCQPVTWAERQAGSETTCPAPSFVGKSLSEIFFHQNRLGVTAGECIVLSGSGDLYNFWRQTATDLLADDPIDIKSAHKDVALFDHAFLWRGDLCLGSGAGHQFALRGDPVLTPTTVRLEHLSSYPMSRSCRPLVLGDRVFLPRTLTGFARVQEYFIRPQAEDPSAEDITQHIPSYLTGAPMALCGDAAMEFVGLVTNGATDTLWVYTYHYEGMDRQQGGWSKWTFPGVTQVVSCAMADGVVYLLLIRSDGVYLEKIDLGNVPSSTADHRDRQGSGATLLTYQFNYKLSTLYLRDERTGEATTSGRLQMRFLDLDYFDAKTFSVIVTLAGRVPSYTYNFSSASVAKGQFRVPLLARNTDVTIQINTSDAAAFALSGYAWEGFYTTRARRMY